MQRVWTFCLLVYQVVHQISLHHFMGYIQVVRFSSWAYDSLTRSEYRNWRLEGHAVRHKRGWARSCFSDCLSIKPTFCPVNRRVLTRPGSTFVNNVPRNSSVFHLFSIDKNKIKTMYVNDWQYLWIQSLPGMFLFYNKLIVSVILISYIHLGLSEICVCQWRA